MAATIVGHKNTINSKLKILFWNIRSANNKKDELEKLISDLDIFIGVESWLKKGSDFSINGFKIFRKDRSTRGGGILFAIRNGIKFEPLETQVQVDPSVEIAAVKIHGFSQVINLFAVYRAPSVEGRPSNLSQDKWDEIAKLSRTHDGISYLLGDFNAHNIQWNCYEDDTNGIRFLNSLNETDLIILNNEGTSHINISNGNTSNIDLLIADADSAAVVDNLFIHDERYGSDHFPFCFNISLQKYIYRKKSFKLRSTKTDWDAVNNTLEERYTEFFDLDFEMAPASQKYDRFFYIVTSAIVENTPKRKEFSDKRHTNPVEWWDEECEKLKRLRRAAFKKWIFSKTLDDKINYKKSRAVLRRAIKKKKRECYVKFTESIDLKKNAGYVWNKMKIFKNKWQKVEHGISDSQEKKFSQMASETLDKLAASPSNKSPPFNSQPHPNEHLDQLFTFAELNQAIESRDCSSGSGTDGIDYFTIARLPIKYKLILLDIFNEMYKNSDYPEVWKSAFVHLIKKPGNTGLRPITMTQCLSKILEIMMKNRLQWWCESNNIFSKVQCGFRKSRSSVDNIYNLSLQVQDGFKAKKDTIAVFFDIQGAFDNVVPTILFNNLADIGCSLNFINFVSHLTLDRKITSVINMDEPRPISKGVPQGGVLSPLLFNIYIRKIAEEIPEKVNVSQFADDLAIFCTDDSTDTCSELIQTATNKIQENLEIIGLQLNDVKTKMIHFNNRNILPGDIQINVGNSLITSNDTARFLGIILDYKLSFEHHVKKIVRKTQNIMNIMKMLSRTWWGAHLETLLNLYKSFVRSSIDYGLFVYWPKWRKFSNLLENIQIASIRSALGYRISTPKNIILEESKLLSLVDRAELQGNKFISKVLSNKSHSCFSSVESFYKKYKKCKAKKRIFEKAIIRTFNAVSPLIFQTDSEIIYQFDYESSFLQAPVDMDSGKLLVDSLLINADFRQKFGLPGLTHIFTDASKEQDQPVGWAVYVPDEKAVKMGSMDKQASIFTGEAVAISSALKWILHHPDKKYCLFSDSKSVLTALCSAKYNKNPYIAVIKDQVAKIKRISILQEPLKFVWIPAHCGIEGNESVDGLAKKASIISVKQGLIPYSDYNMLWIKEAREKTFQLNIQEGDHKGVYYFHNYLNMQTTPWYHDLNFNRREIVTINRLRANHYNSASSLYRKNIIPSADCSCGHPDQDANHLLWQCSELNNNREILLRQLSEMEYNGPFLIEHILTIMNIKVLKCILNFLMLSKLNL